MFPIVYLAIWMLLEGVSVLGVGLISGGTEAGFYVSSAISKVLLLLFTMGLWRFARIMGIGKEPYSGSAIFLLLPVSGMGLYHLLYLLLYRVKDGRMDNWWGMLLIAMILLVLNISFYPIYLKMIQAGYIKTREYFYKEQIELFSKEKEWENRAAMELCEMRHDMKQSLIYLNSLLRNGKVEKAYTVLEEMTAATLEKGETPSRTGNMAVDSLLNHAWNQAKEYDVVFHLKEGNLPELSIKDTDLCILLGNALDNAYEASRKCSGKREIWASLQYNKGCLLFQLKNRYESRIELSGDGKILSAKKEPGHGLGLCSIEKIARKYGGSVEIHIEEKGIFLIEILIRC